MMRNMKQHSEFQDQFRPDCGKLLSELMLAYLTKGFEFFNSFVQCVIVGDEAFLRPSELQLIKKKKKSEGAPHCLVECLA